MLDIISDQDKRHTHPGLWNPNTRNECWEDVEGAEPSRTPGTCVKWHTHRGNSLAGSATLTPGTMPEEGPTHTSSQGYTWIAHECEWPGKRPDDGRTNSTTKCGEEAASVRGGRVETWLPTRRPWPPAAGRTRACRARR